MICSSGADVDVDHDRDAAEALVLGGRHGQAMMLKPRRAKRPATRASTPALFSTRTERMWCWMSSWSCSLDDVLRRGRGRRRCRRCWRRRRPSGTPSPSESVRKSMTTGRSSISLAFSMAGLDLLGRLDPHADAAHRLGPHLVVGQVGRQVHLGVALLVEHLLPLADHAEVGVVEDGDLHRDALGRRGDQLLGGHLEAAVAVDGPHHAVGPADLGADGGRARRSPSCRGRRSSPRCRGGRTSSTATSTSGAGRRREATMQSSGVLSRSCSSTNCGLSASPGSDCS